MTAQHNVNKLAFLSMEAPPGYVAGLGRGASGFTTRSDIGPAREGPSAETIAAAKAKRGDIPDEGDGGVDDEQFQDPESETGLFAGSVYEKDDEEADAIWDRVDKQMEERRRKQREAREKEELARYREERPKIQAQFADLKRGLSNVTEEEWADLPEASNLTGKRRKAMAKRESRNTSDYVVPDSVLLSNRDRGAMDTSISASDGEASSLAGVDSGAVTSLTEIGEARNKIFSHKLDEASSSNKSAADGAASSIDPKGYLTELSSVVTRTSAEIGDIKKARSLMDSVIKTNPKHAPGWIAAARLEEYAGKMAIARKVIAQGCEQCPKSEEVWIEAARLNTRDNAKVILARAVQHLSQSVKIWQAAVHLENDAESKKRVLRKSLEYIPNSVKLWKELVNLEENPEDARVLLSGAVEAVPTSVELWLALARLCVPKEAEAVLNRARKTIPTSHEIWIAALRLMEEQGRPEKDLESIMARAVAILQRNGAVLNREQWFREAEKVEREGGPLTSAAIIKATIALDVDEEDRQTVWVEDAQAAVEKGNIEVARTIFSHTLAIYPYEPSIWRQAAEIEKKHGTRETMEDMLEKSVTNCPNDEALWLMYAKERRLADDLDGARAVLARAFDKNMGSEEISLAAAKLEAENGDKEAAGLLLQRARQEVGSARVWMKSAAFERAEGRKESALALVEEALTKYPKHEKLHMMHGQLLLVVRPAKEGENIRAARSAYARAVKDCPQSVALWILSSRLEEQASLAIRARALLEKARLANPKNERLWAESVAVEERAGSQAQAKTMLARGLQECPRSGLLATQAIWYEPKPKRRTASADALRRSENHPQVVSSVARLFWNERLLEKARAWFEKVAQADPDWGDGWAWWYKFEQQHGTDEMRAVVLRRCVNAEPRHGDEWQIALKDPDVHRSTAQVLAIVASRLQLVS
ncbi:hypothetical protein K437DRAFT_221659 [Tilletiaria anomala UBC 951]|uniref:PRP1 splicing factor N-terminal domain-containing protein n=1 Tax=Tilletiaria anomala (strain ATCC 24038 / CBS 436.72 / UBC 951) TaxID=1037660 RepID=A0A066WL65_TILAU|nr:uncharacterized protein K437DRAFT_221659 [Tilletiaria anomala UBC 951]KDN51340.1 hypothetical protein K437DRAFT_221659 [Tilletiaria anomala UBC 951]